MNGLDLANRLFGATTRDDARRPRARRSRRRSRAAGGRAAAAAPAAVTAPAPLRGLTHRAGAAAARSGPPRAARRAARRHLFPYLNLQMLLGKHLGLRGAVGAAARAGRRQGASSCTRSWSELQREAVGEGLIQRRRALPVLRGGGPRAIALILFEDGREVGRFDFPRQPGGERLCLADYVRDSGCGEPRLRRAVRGHLRRGRPRRSPSAGRRRASTCARTSLQALAIETAEAFAEMLHARLRTQWGFPDPPELPIAGQAQGPLPGDPRVASAIPACPNLADQRQLFRLLRPEQRRPRASPRAT